MLNCLTAWDELEHAGLPGWVRGFAGARKFLYGGERSVQKRISKKQKYPFLEVFET